MTAAAAAAHPTAAFNALWAGVIVEELVRLGVDHFVIAPGSRSTPLTLAATRHPATRCVLHIDERGAAFWALGFGRGARRAAAVICTSGTAAANFLPATVEASLDNVPLLLLTADRPPELRDTAANQTIAQPGLFGDYPRWQVDMPTPDRSVPPQALLTTLDQAVARTTGGTAGPVHLNMPFREPLSGAAPDWTDDWLAPVDGWLGNHTPLTRYGGGAVSVSAADADLVGDALRAASRGLLVVGRLASTNETVAARAVATRLGWPVIADVASGMRGAEAPAALVRHADLILRDRESWADLRPDVVLHLGGEAVSKPLAQFLAAARPARLIRVLPTPRRHDPAHQTTDRLVCDLDAFAAMLERVDLASPDARWCAMWSAVEATVAAAIAGDMGGVAVDEPGTARILAGSLPDDWGLFLGSSMPIRDADIFASHTPAHVAANRGASGIDGTLASACGYAAGLGRPVALLCGDLAALHDLNALLVMREADPPVLAVVVNNDGGGIFHFLPVTAETDRFEAWFGTPHGLDLAPLARGFGLEVVCPETTDAFASAVAAFVASPRPLMMELRTEREANRARHRDLEARARAAR